jgi:hypothetical protein
MISTTASTIVIIADAALAAILVAGVAYAARRLHRPAVLWLGAGAVLAWFGVAFALAHEGVFETDASTAMPPAIAPAIVIPTLLGCALLALAPARRAIDRVPLHWLVGVQAYRVVGGVVLIAWLQHDVPGEFALPAGIGDVLVGIAAPLVALSLVRGSVDGARTRVLAWCALGILDLVVAVTCGFLTAPSVVQQLALSDPNAAIGSYPLVLIPIFAVPVSFVLHVYVIARLRPRAAGAGAAVAGVRAM